MPGQICCGAKPAAALSHTSFCFQVGRKTARGQIYREAKPDCAMSPTLWHPITEDTKSTQRLGN